MHARHEPDKQFVENLEWQIGGEIRRRSRAVVGAHPAWRLARAALLVVVSMAFGAAAMGASYQIEESWRRDLLLAGLEVRVELARQRAQLAAVELQRVQRQFEVGIVDEQTRSMTELQVADARAQVTMLELDLEEVRAGGREPRNDVAAPLVSGRDFVSERIEIEIDVINRRLGLALEELQRAQQRHDIGVETTSNVESLRSGMQRIQAQRGQLGDRLTFRRGFLDGEITAVEAELYVMRSEAERSSEALRSQIMAVATEVERMRSRVDTGTADANALLVLQLGLAEIEAELRLAQIEQQIIQRELDAQREPRR